FRKLTLLCVKLLADYRLGTPMQIHTQSFRRRASLLLLLFVTLNGNVLHRIPHGLKRHRPLILPIRGSLLRVRLFLKTYSSLHSHPTLLRQTRTLFLIPELSLSLLLSLLLCGPYHSIPT